ncbi:hypothetical protein BMF35_a1478 [Aurantiacibacter gangjinensis]|nr:hypothetical protein BMF35_a1478 [Aurantiacibacter gangjinensis]
MSAPPFAQMNKYGRNAAFAARASSRCGEPLYSATAVNQEKGRKAALPALCL